MTVKPTATHAGAMETGIKQQQQTRSFQPLHDSWGTGRMTSLRISSATLLTQRFYMAYVTDDLKLYVTRTRFHVGPIPIKPTGSSTTGYVPHLPYYINCSTMEDLLALFGTHSSGDFVRTKLGNSRWLLTRTLEYNGCTMDVKYDDDLRQWRYCGLYGHLIGWCR